MLNDKEIDHLTKLIRLELQPAERERLQKDLSMILDYVQQLNNVNTDDVEGLAWAGEQHNVFRDDIATECASATQRALVDAAPLHGDGVVKVKAVFDTRE